MIAQLLGHFRFDEIYCKIICEFKVTRKRTGVTDAIVMRDLSFLCSIFAAAIERGWVDRSPVTVLNEQALKVSRSSIRLTIREGFIWLSDNASTTLKSILVFAVKTVMQ